MLHTWIISAHVSLIVCHVILYPLVYVENEFGSLLAFQSLFYYILPLYPSFLRLLAFCFLCFLFTRNP